VPACFRPGADVAWRFKARVLQAGDSHVLIRSLSHIGI
jgi:hypothetical protein